MEDNKKILTEVTHNFQTVKAKQVKLKSNYNFFNLNIFKLLLNRIITIILIPFILLYSFIFLGLRIKGYKNYFKNRKKGFIVISNHIHPLDSFLITLLSFPRFLFTVTLTSNFGLPFVGFIIKNAGGVSIPNNIHETIKFNKTLNYAIHKKNRKVLILPEASLEYLCDHIRPFSETTFKFALKNKINILPICFTYRNKLFNKKKKALTINFLPIEDKSFDNSKDMTIYYYDLLNEYFTNNTSFK